MNRLLSLLLLLLVHTGFAQPAPARHPTETNRFAIEIAGIRVGTVTAVREEKPGNRAVITTISDVKIRLLVYTIKVYYKAITQFDRSRLTSSFVDAHTNRGNYMAKTDWTGNQYDVVAHQYKYDHTATIRDPIDNTLLGLYFAEPIGRKRIYSEYFGDFFSVEKTGPGQYTTRLDEKEDEYVYKNGQLAKVIRHNKIKNFVLTRLSTPD